MEKEGKNYLWELKEIADKKDLCRLRMIELLQRSAGKILIIDLSAIPEDKSVMEIVSDFKKCGVLTVAQPPDIQTLDLEINTDEIQKLLDQYKELSEQETKILGDLNSEKNG